MQFVDIHCHYEDERFNEDRSEVISSLRDSGVLAFVDSACSVFDWDKTREMAEKYDNMYFCAGVHPENASELTLEREQELKELWRHERCVGAGEMGLDYHFEGNPEKSVQRDVFARQVSLAKECDMPIVIHTRDAIGDTLEMIRSEHIENAVMHCFSESAEVARECVERGLYFSFGGVCTFKNARLANDNLMYIPRDRILLETDSPYLAPVPKRGERNDSRNIRYVIEHIAMLWNMSPDEVADITTENAKRFYRLDFENRA